MEGRPKEAALIGRTRLRIPRQPLIDRPRLMQMLEARSSARLTIIQAPAGYGKSSLLQQWAYFQTERGATVAWLSIEERNRDPLVFVKHVFHALIEADFPIPQNLSDMVGHENYYSWEVMVTALCDSFIDLPAPAYLFIDDCQVLKDSEALNCLRDLMENAPPELRLVLASREDIGIPLGRLRALGDVFEIHSDELKFVGEEMRSYLTQNGHQVLGEDSMRLLEERSEGWIVALKLFSMALNLDPDSGKTLESISGEVRQIADFFAEDVLARQSPKLQDFLMRTSVFDRFYPAMCDAALEIDNSRELIDECEVAGLFLIPLNQTRTWYRYHHLFAEFLRRQLQDHSPGAVAGLYGRASDFLAAAGHHIDAFETALKGDNPIKAAEILDAHCEDMWAAGAQKSLQEMGARIPLPVLSLYPRLMLLLAWRLSAEWKFTDARNYVAVAKARLNDIEKGSPKSPDIKKLNLLVQHRESQLAHSAYEVESLENLCSSAIHNTDELSRDPYLLASFYNSLQYAQREQFKLGKLDRFDFASREQIAKTASRHGEVFIAAISGPSYLLSGRTEKAEEILKGGLEIAERLAGRQAPLGSLVALPLAQIYYERNEIEIASGLVEEYLPRTIVGGMVDPLAAGWMTQSRIRKLKCDNEGAMRSLEAAAEFGTRHDLDRLRIAANAEILWLLLRLGMPDEAATFARRRGLVAYSEARSAGDHNSRTVLDSLVALSICRLLASQDRFGDALAMARQWRSFVSAAQAVQHAIRWDILLAELLYMSGDQLAAQRALSRAIPRAAPGRFIRSFLDEGEPIATLLQQMTPGSLSEQDDNAGDRFLKELVHYARTTAGSELAPVDDEEDDSEEALSLCGKMSDRELEILTLAGAGMQNRQIGKKLGLTEGTVKWYLQQSFDKLGIRDRFRAAQRARRLGLIP